MHTVYDLPYSLPSHRRICYEQGARMDFLHWKILLDRRMELLTWLINRSV